jgi:acyl-CoA synthetase (NDP forming)/RimJ/RimL family protein N-acetyltransferase
MKEPQPPAHWEADVVLADGGTVRLRPIHPADGPALVALHSRLSERTRYLRFFGPYPTMPERDVHRFTHVDYDNRVALVATLGEDVIAVGRYDRLDGNSAEVAFVVQDDQQGRGISSILLEHLAAAARERGIHRFEAEVLAENAQMVRVFRQAGYTVSRELDSGVIHLEFEIDPTERSVEVALAREQAAEARSVRNLLHARSVAVVGASTDQSKIGHAVLLNLLRSDFAGPVYPVNPEARAVRGVRAYPTVADIPDEVDLAVIAVPPRSVAKIADDCMAKRVKGLLVITSAVDEADQTTQERTLVAEARAHGMRVVGPNALGLVNTAPDVRLNASLAPVVPGRGRVGFFCQSGALGITILAEAAQRGLGLSTFVSAGHRADLSGNDLLQYWQTDEDTDVVLLYLESYGNPRKFARLARRLARTKPIIAVTTGRPTGRTAGDGAVVDAAGVQALFAHTGVITVDSQAALFDAAVLLANQPLPAGRRIAIVGNSSALGVLAADAALASGLVLADEPLDVGVAAAPEAFAAAVRQALLREEVDALVAVFVSPIEVEGTEHARALRAAVAGSNTGREKPVVCTFLGAETIPEELAVRGPDGAPSRGSLPSYSSPERAVRALARAARYAEWRSRPVGEFGLPDGMDAPGARRLAEAVLVEQAEGRVMTAAETQQLLHCAGIDLVPLRAAVTEEDAVAVAGELGYPVAVKAAGAQWRHRTDLVGVRLDLGSPDAVRAAYRDLVQLAGEPQVFVQQMAPKGVACIFALGDDPVFGSVLSFGLGGVLSDLLGDHAYRAVPLSDLDAAEMIREPKAAPLLTGYRGTTPVDLDALAELALRISRLAEQLPQLRQLSLQPVLTSASGAFVTGATATIGPIPARLDDGPRRLR